MSHFDYNDPLNLLTPDIVKKIAMLREYKGKQALCLQVRPDILEKLCASAKIRSTDVSNRIKVGAKRAWQSHTYPNRLFRFALSYKPNKRVGFSYGKEKHDSFR